MGSLSRAARESAWPMIQLMAALSILAGVAMILSLPYALVADGVLLLAGATYLERAHRAVDPPPPPPRPAPEVDAEGFPHSVLSPGDIDWTGSQ